MKLLACLLVLVAVLAAPATASAPTLKTLQRQITALRAQVIAEQRSLTQLAQIEQQGRGLEVDQNNRITCNYAIGSDNLNLVWHTLNLLAQYNGFPPQPDFPRYDDGGACAALGVTRGR